MNGWRSLGKRNNRSCFLQGVQEYQAFLNPSINEHPQRQVLYLLAQIIAKKAFSNRYISNR